MIEAIKKGDVFAFEQAYRETCGKVYGYFLKKTKSTEDARDLLQTTYLKLWQYRASLSPDFLLDQHLFQMARTVFIDYMRRQNVQCKAISSITERMENATSNEYISTEFDLKAHLQNALSAMPATRKKVFELNRLQGYSYQEVSQMLSISVKAVDNNLSKALRQLRKVFILISIISALLH